MSGQNKIQLKPSCILSVPLHVYEEDFSFIVNGEEFKTSRVISDLLSPKISRMHAADPTLCAFAVNTRSRGDFSRVLRLLNFEEQEVPERDLPFLAEVLCELGSDSASVACSIWSGELTADNVFGRIAHHERYESFFSEQLLCEKGFIAAHFSDLRASKGGEMKRLGASTLYSILSSGALQAEDEDELLNFANEMYKADAKFSVLYETIYFENVTPAAMREFIETFDPQHMSIATWQRLSDRLTREVEGKSEVGSEIHQRKYRKKAAAKRGVEISKEENRDFCGIINYLRTKTSNKIENEIKFTASSVVSSGVSYQPQNVSLFDDRSKCFESDNQPNNWISLEFKEHRVIPTHYTIRSTNWCGKNWCHMRSWAVECSNDGSSWDTLDSQSNSEYLNGSGLFHTFALQNQQSKEYRFIRIRSTGPNWSGNNFLIFDSFEIYGTLI